MNTTDSIIVKGDFQIDVYENGKHVETIVENNLVITLGKTDVARLIGGHASGKKIDTIGVGTGSAAAAVTDTTLMGAFTKAVDSVTYPDAQSVMFHFDIDNSEANGMDIWEFGLLNTDGVLFSRKVRGAAIVKTNLIRLVGTWKININ
jgi:hypothetical protein